MQHELISKEAFIKATKLQRFRIAAGALMGLTGIKRINALYQKASDKEGLAFIEAILKELKVRYKVKPEELAHLPKDGAFITVSNHPFGALDGLILAHLICTERPDYKLLANFLLKNVKPIEDYFIAVNPFENQPDLASSMTGMKNALLQLKKSAPLGIFPAGEVSSFKTNTRVIVDREWQLPALKLIKHAEVPIIPVYFKGSNSLLFHLLGMLHPSLRTIALPSEMLKKKKRTIRVRIGKPISAKDQKEWEDVAQFGRFLRAKTYSLGSSLEVKRFYQLSRPLVKKKVESIPSANLKAVRKEIEGLKKHRLFSQANFEVYLAFSHQIPAILNEIGRLRELTFRAVGEGSNKAVDLDEYDLYYHHLFLWDKEAKQIAGSYRLGKGNDIFKKYGEKGFYTNSLFQMDSGFHAVLQSAIEMGRSFVVKEYQQKRLPLFLLWRGIMEFILKNPEYRYLIGPVSISNSYSKLSRSLIVTFIQQYYFNEELAKHISARKNFKAKLKKVETAPLLENVKDDIKRFDKVLSDIEPENFTAPVLLKKYLRQNARIIGFNVDPKFNDALDGLMILDLHDLPAETLKQLKRDIRNTSATP